MCRRVELATAGSLDGLVAPRLAHGWSDQPVELSKWRRDRKNQAELAERAMGDLSRQVEKEQQQQQQQQMKIEESKKLKYHQDKRAQKLQDMTTDIRKRFQADLAKTQSSQAKVLLATSTTIETTTL